MPARLPAPGVRVAELDADRPVRGEDPQPFAGEGEQGVEEVGGGGFAADLFVFVGVVGRQVGPQREERRRGDDEVDAGVGQFAGQLEGVADVVGEAHVARRFVMPLMPRRSESRSSGVSPPATKPSAGSGSVIDHW
jgi:hypothetical protein